MKAAKRQVEEIRRLEKAIEKTKSNHLKNDYSKNIRTLKMELKEYCGYRGFDYEKVLSGDFTV